MIDLLLLLHLQFIKSTIINENASSTRQTKHYEYIYVFLILFYYYIIKVKTITSCA
jgi:hypothetical protein